MELCGFTGTGPLLLNPYLFYKYCIVFRFLFCYNRWIIELRIIMSDNNGELRAMKGNIWDHWPMPEYEPRESQKIAAEWMADLPAHIKYVMCEIPVGGGKSPLALTYAGFCAGGIGTSYILTPQRILQRQYEESFDRALIASVYGKSNYDCHTKIGLDCDIGDDIKPKCMNCPAKAAFGEAISTPNMVLNYKLALLYSELLPDDMFPRRDLMVFDECHTLEGHLVDHRALTVTERRCKELNLVFPNVTELKDAYEWIKGEYWDTLTTQFNILNDSVLAIDNRNEFSSGSSLTADEIRTKKKHKEYKRHRELIRKIIRKDMDQVNREYVLIRDKTNFMFKELYGKNIFKNILLPKADKFLFLSSTILNKESYCNDLGIPMEETEMISLPSEFDTENRPVYFMPTMKMAYGWDKKEKQSDRNKMVSKIVKLCNIHAEDSGIIHSGSFRIAKWLVEELRDKIPHKIIDHNPDSDNNRDDVVEMFTDNQGKEPMLLISPSITEGLDLKEDAARFAIFAKVPYPYMGDQWVKKRMELSNEWYQRQAMIAIIQGGGRVVRTNEDWGNTYILDESFNFLWFKMKRHTPTWWKQGFVKVK